MSRWLTGQEAVDEIRMWCALHGVPISRLLARANVNRSLLTRWSRGAAPQRRVWERIIAAQDEMAEGNVSIEQLLGG